MTILLFIIVIILLIVFFPTLLFLLFSGALGIVGDTFMLAISFILSLPIMYMVFKLRCSVCDKICKETNRYKESTLKTVENDLGVNNKSSLNISILSGVIYGFIGLVVYNETHTYQTHSGGAMFFSTMIPAFIGISISYNLIQIFRLKSEIKRMDNAKIISEYKKEEREHRKKMKGESMTKKAGN